VDRKRGVEGEETGRVDEAIGAGAHEEADVVADRDMVDACAGDLVYPCATLLERSAEPGDGRQEADCDG
jgi:hypothetical protein